MSHLDLISDHSKEKLVTVPVNVLDMNNLKMLFLEGNFLTALPDDLFWKLPKLMWLDVRNNLLENIPTSIAFHEKLENLLLSNNNFERLPNELGTVPNLKTLQISENPLIYPERKILVEGIKAIKTYLKAEYDKMMKIEDTSERITEVDDYPKSDEEAEERLLRKVEFENSDIFSDTDKSIELSKSLKGSKDETSADKIKTKVSDEQFTNPDLEVKKLLPPLTIKKNKQPLKITHKVSKTQSKIYLKSSLTTANSRSTEKKKKTFNNLKEGWLNELRILLTDQERILQQERNLRAISKWRLKTRDEFSEEGPRVFYGDILKPPYDVDPEYNKMPTREELARQLAQFKQKGVIKLTTNVTKNRPMELQKMIREIMGQLKEMELEYNPTNSNAEMENAENQIRAMMDIQKKLMNLKSINDTIL